MTESSDLRRAQELALAEAYQYLGLTAPNPPVGAAALDAQGEILGVAAHRRAGEPHAEARLLSQLKENGSLHRIHTLLVTLEPCNHQGRTPPCTQAILNHCPQAHVIFGSRDPNPNVQGGGAEALRQAGVRVTEGFLREECDLLIRSFRHWVLYQRPWVVLKTAFRSAIHPPSQTHQANGILNFELHAQDAQKMIPDPGTKTFTSQKSLELAHQIRRQSGAILTGSGTVIADLPEFTVRLVPDFPSDLKKPKPLWVMDRRGRTPKSWIQKATANGFEVSLIQTDLAQALTDLGKLGIHQVLVEAGPELTSSFLKQGLWNEHLQIITHSSAPKPIPKPIEDTVLKTFNKNQGDAPLCLQE